MRFKAWCLMRFGIENFSEGKIIDRVFIPFNNEDICYLDELMQACRGFIIQVDGEKGVSFTKKAYLCLERNLKIKYEYLNNQIFDEDKFEYFKEEYFKKRGLDIYLKNQFRMPPTIHLKITNEQAKQQLMQQFAYYHPTEGYDSLTKTNTVQMPCRFIKKLYSMYYKSKYFKTNTNLTYLENQKLRLDNYLSEIEKDGLKLNLGYAQKLALDYDNHYLNNMNACKSYALLLKIYAELYKEILTNNDYHLFYEASRLIATDDQQKHLKKSLATDTIFIRSLYILYNSALEVADIKNQGGPLSINSKEKIKLIYEAIDRNTKELLYGSYQKNNVALQAQRFLPDLDNNSGTNEIILQGGGRLGHFAVFRLIKVPMLANGQRAKLNEKPSYFDYFKAESNLGAGCNQLDQSKGTCLGTYLTKIQPYFRNSMQEFELFSQDPSTDPQFYQAAIEETLIELINVERQILFYREPSDLNNLRYSQPLSEEATEWTRLNQLLKLLSGKAHNQRVQYVVPDLLNSTLKHSRFVENQMGYMQTGGSCPIFSIKSVVKSIIGPELTSLFNHFMQTHNVMDCEKALNKLINRNNRIIKKLEPLSINGYRKEIMIWIKEFKEFLSDESIYFEVIHEKRSNQSTIILREAYLKNQWFLFIKARQGSKENRNSQNDFFRRPNLQQPFVINVESQNLPRL